MAERNIHDHLAENLIAACQDGDSGTPTLARALLRDAVEQRATDVHLEPDRKACAIRFRIDGVLHDVARLPRDTFEQLSNQLKVLASLDPLPAAEPVSSRFSIDVDGAGERIDVRLSAVTAFLGERVTLRLLTGRDFDALSSTSVMPAAKLNSLMSRVIQREGLLLVSGPTSSGKTTTIYTLLHKLASEPRSILTIEDPPELEMPGITQIAVNKEHGISFASGIQAAMRMDPDYILVGELRSEESMRAALNAATTGCLVMGTLHARDAVGVITSLRKWNADRYELSTLLSVVIAQRLVRRLCPQCRRSDEMTADERDWFHALALDPLDDVWRPVGCHACQNLGYLGRTAVFETWMLDEADRKRIMHRADESELRHFLAERGHEFLLADAVKKIESGETDVSQVQSMGGFSPSLAVASQPPVSLAEVS